MLDPQKSDRIYSSTRGHSFETAGCPNNDNMGYVHSEHLSRQLNQLSMDFDQSQVAGHVPR